MKAKWIGLAVSATALIALAVAVGGFIYFRPVQEPPPGWSVLAGDSSQWDWKHGRITAHTTTGDAIFASSEEYGDVTFSARVGTTNREASLAIRLQDQNNGYFIVFAPARTPGNEAGFVRLAKRVDGRETTLAEYQKRKMAIIGLSAKMKVIARGPAIQVYLNGIKILQAHDTTFPGGCIGFRVYGWGDYPCDATFTGVRFH